MHASPSHAGIDGADGGQDFQIEPDKAADEDRVFARAARFLMLPREGAHSCWPRSETADSTTRNCTPLLADSTSLASLRRVGRRRLPRRFCAAIGRGEME
jgi:hypothetical protein